jgi:hypothetical protein
MHIMRRKSEQLNALPCCLPLSPLEGVETVRVVLERRGLLTEAVRHELQNGLHYWRGERWLSKCMLTHPAIPAEGHDAGFTLEDLHEISEMKSFDYRVRFPLIHEFLLEHASICGKQIALQVMHLLLYALIKLPPNEDLLEYLFVDEILVDIGDDLYDYEDDVARNSFNIFRGMFVCGLRDHGLYFFFYDGSFCKLLIQLVALQAMCIFLGGKTLS